MSSESGWRILTDGVMGGLSEGRLDLLREDGRDFARLTGRVSTANRGGFIQIRRPVSPPPAGATGVRLVLRGDGQRYFVHLRTGACALPWHYYQAGFDAPRDWGEVRLPWDAFRASDRRLPAAVDPATVTTLGVVAYGRDHDARIDVRDAGFA